VVYVSIWHNAHPAAPVPTNARTNFVRNPNHLHPAQGTACETSYEHLRKYYITSILHKTCYAGRSEQKISDASSHLLPDKRRCAFLAHTHTHTHTPTQTRTHTHTHTHTHTRTHTTEGFGICIYNDTMSSGLTSKKLKHTFDFAEITHMLKTCYPIRGLVKSL